jgi:hypothetical protein
MPQGLRSVRRFFDATTLATLRELPSDTALERIAIAAKADSTYRPVKQRSSRRWHVLTACGEFEILTTGTKWYDTRARKGGGGAIDLAMHVLQLSFVDAVRRLIGQDHGADHS